MPEETDYKLYPDFHSEERVRYYSGQFLSTQDFVDEQRYILDRLRRALDGITAHGVAKGLDVSSPANGKLRLTPGTAIDPRGRQLVLAKLRDGINIPDQLRGNTIDVTIYYRELEIRPQGEGGEATRIHESPGVELVKTGAKPKNASGVVLARVQVAQNGKCTFEAPDPARKFAGIAFPTSSDAHPTLRSGAPARPQTLDLNASLSVGQSLGIGTLTPETPLDVRGLAKFEHLHIRHKEFKVGGDVSKFYPIVFEDRGWGAGGLHLEISRPDANMDGNAAGSLVARFSLHAPAGHGSGYLHFEIHQSHRFVARANHVGNSRYFVVWLRGNRTYRWRANHDAALTNAAAQQKKIAGITLKLLTKVDATLDRNDLVTTPPVYQPKVLGPLTVEGDINYTGLLSKLDTQEVPSAVVRTKELLLGHSTQRGTPGKALVDQKSALVINEGSAWEQTRVEGSYVHMRGRLHINTGAIDTELANTAQATVVAENSHMQLTRPKNQIGGRKLFLEIRQEDTAQKTVPEVATCIRFHHEHRYWHRIECSNNGFHIRDGSLENNAYSSLYTGFLKATGDTEVTGKATIAGNLEVKGASTFTGDVRAKANLSVTGTMAAARLELTRSSDHLLLKRAASERTGGRLLFLELRQDDVGQKKVPETHPSIRFTHSHRYSHRIEARSGGLYFLSGDLSKDNQFRTLHTGNLNVHGSISTTDHGASTLRCFDFMIGHKNRRGSPGRALVDFKSGSTTQLHVNYGSDWNQLHLGGSSVHAPKETYIGGKPAVAGLSETGLRVLRGTVSAGGSITAGSGFTIGKEGHKWKVSFRTAFATIPTVIATQQYPDNNNTKDGGNTRDNAIVVAVSKSWAYIKTGNGSGDHSWRRFHFVAIGT